MLESVLFDCRYFLAPIDMDDFLWSSRMFPPFPCLLPKSVVADTCRPASCRPPFDVDELPADEGVLEGGGDSDGKSSGSAATYVLSTSSMPGPED